MIETKIPRLKTALPGPEAKKVLKLDSERYQKWISVGAQPSGTLAAVIRRTARAQKSA